jgi:AraC-like DNA-binding protein
MKAYLEQITTKSDCSIAVLNLNLSRFNGPYHFHPELELTWIRKSSGTRYLGGNVSEYEPGDLVLAGADVPHCWRSNDLPEAGSAQAIVIQFSAAFAGNAFLELPEMAKVKRLFEKAKAGILIKGGNKEKIISKMKQCVFKSGLDRLLTFIEILNLISGSSENELIDQQYTTVATSPFETDRFQKVFSYLIDNYHQEINLKTVAGLANLTPTAFCRYFKNVTRKTLIEILTEFRINQACELLRTTEKSVNEICFECGFGNISYFNKAFKAATAYTPLQYRSMFLK